MQICGCGRKAVYVTSAEGRGLEESAHLSIPGRSLRMRVPQPFLIGKGLFPGMY